MSRGHRHQKKRPAIAFIDRLVNYLIVETIESLLELSPFGGREICDSLRAQKLPTLKYVGQMLQELGDQHSSTVEGCYSLGVLNAVLYGQIPVMMSVVLRYYPGVQDLSFIAFAIASGSSFLCSYVGSLATYLIVGDEAKSASILSILFAIGFGISASLRLHGFDTAYTLPMTISLIVGLYFGSWSARGFRRVAQILRRD